MYVELLDGADLPDDFDCSHMVMLLKGEMENDAVQLQRRPDSMRPLNLSNTDAKMVAMAINHSLAVLADRTVLPQQFCVWAASGGQHHRGRDPHAAGCEVLRGQAWNGACRRAGDLSERRACLGVRCPPADGYAKVLRGSTPQTIQSLHSHHHLRRRHRCAVRSVGRHQAGLPNERLHPRSCHGPVYKTSLLESTQTYE